MDTASEIRLQALYQPFAEKLRSIDAEFQRQTDGDHLEVVQGLRSYEDQQRLWMIGRNAQGNIVDESKIVTRARPGYSWHEFALAADVVPRSLLPLPGWNPSSPLWPMIDQIAQTYGIEQSDCGGDWKRPDRPHLQWTGRFPATPTDEVRALYASGGLQAVWNALGV